MVTNIVVFFVYKSLVGFVMVVKFVRIVSPSATLVSGFVVDLGWLLSGLTASTGVYEIVPGFIVSFLAAYLVARFTEAPNAEAVAIFEEATKPDAD